MAMWDEDDDDVFEFSEESFSSADVEQEIPIEYQYMMNVESLDSLDDSRNAKFGQQYYSEFYLDSIIALRRLPGLLSSISIEDFKSDIFPIIMQIATQCTDNASIEGLIMSLNELMGCTGTGECDANVSVNAYREVDLQLFLYNNQPDTQLIQIEKSLLLELMPQVVHTFLYCTDYSCYADNEIFLYQCKNILHFVMPLLLGLILSSYNIDFLERAYQILQIVLDEMASISRILTTDYLGFSKVYHYKLPFVKNSDMLDQKLHYYDILDEFNEIISYYFVLFPYLRLSLPSYRIDVSSVHENLFSTCPLVCLTHFQDDDYLLLRCAVYPHSEQEDDFIYQEQIVLPDKINLIMDNVRYQQRYLLELYINIIYQMSPYYSMRVSIPILTVLIKQLSGRPLHAYFIKDLSDRFFTYKGELIKHYLYLIHHNMEEKDEFSLNAPQDLLSNEYRLRVLTAISTTLNDSHRFALRKSQKFAAIQEEIISVLLMIQELDVKMKIPYFLPTFMKNISTKSKLQCCQYYHNHIKSKNKRIVYQFIISLGSFLPEMLDLNFDGIIMDSLRSLPQFNEQLAQLFDLIDFYLDLSNSTFEFSKLEIKIKDCVKFYRIFSEKNLVELPQVCKLYLQLYSIQELDLPLVQRDYNLLAKKYQLAYYIMNKMRENQPINYRYALANEYLRDSSAFKYLLDGAQQRKLFTDILLSMMNLNQMKQILNSGHLDDYWIYLKDKFRDFALKLFFNSIEEKRNEGQIVYIYYKEQVMRYYLNGELYICYERVAKQQYSSPIFYYTVTNAKNYKNRLEYATYLPNIIEKFSADRETLEFILIQVLDIIVYFIYEPVRKIRTTFCRQLGILTGMLINKGMNVQFIIGLLYKLITNETFDDSEISAVLQKLLQRYRPTAYTKCLIAAILYQVIRIAEEKAYGVIGPLLLLLASDSQILVKSAMIKNMHYLAANKCYVVFRKEYINLRGSLLYRPDGSKENDRAIMDFDDQFMASLDRYCDEVHSRLGEK